MKSTAMILMAALAGAAPQGAVNAGPAERHLTVCVNGDTGALKPSRIPGRFRPR
jgi:hypothetical protein